MKPQIIKFSKIGSPNLGYISVAENSDNIPFEVKRVYWTYYTPQDVTRGGHAHYDLEQVIVAVSGSITFTTEDLKGNKREFILDSPDKGLYLPQKIWRDIKFSHSAVLLCMASDKYTVDDYIRNYGNFKKLKDIKNIDLISYEVSVLEKSWKWLNDPEIKMLTKTPDFTREDQEKWFKNLKNSDTYFIKGLQYNGEIIGVVGLKNINRVFETAEYFGYIGEKQYWGKGLSVEILKTICTEAKANFKLKNLYLNVSTQNIRAVRAYENFGFRISKIEAENIVMNLKL